jgi:hypothetical protein
VLDAWFKGEKRKGEGGKKKEKKKKKLNAIAI